MICKVCNTRMKSGTAYERQDKKSILNRRFDECPKCHFREYNGGSNLQKQKMMKPKTNNN